MKALLVLFIVVATVSAAKCDTIDFWHIYLNHSLIGDFSTPGLIKLKSDQIRPGDTLHIEYFNDIGTGWNCFLPIEPGYHSGILFKGVDTAGGITCSLNDALAVKPNEERLIFKLEHYLRDSMMFKVPLFYLQIE